MPLQGFISKKKGWGVFVGHPPTYGPLWAGPLLTSPLVLLPGLPGQFNYYINIQLLVLLPPCFPPLVGLPTYYNSSLFSRYKAL